MPITTATVKDRKRPFQAFATGDKYSLVFGNVDYATLTGNFKGHPGKRPYACVIEAIAAPDRFRNAMTRALGLIAVFGLMIAACGKPQSLNVQTCPRPADLVGSKVSLPAGNFMMGAAAVHPEEGPATETFVPGFDIDATEVTNRQFAEFVAATGYVTQAERELAPSQYPDLNSQQRQPASVVFVPPGQGKRVRDYADWWKVIPGANWRHPEGPESSIIGKEDQPVVHVGFEDALAYADWSGRDLPTEAQWEYASRGGLDSAKYVWGNDPPGPKSANIWQGVFPFIDSGDDGYAAQLAPVGCFPPDDERAEIIVLIQCFAKNLWKTTVVDSGNIIP